MTHRSAVFGLAALMAPLNLILLAIAWQIYRVGVLSFPVFVVVAICVVALMAYQLYKVFAVNRPALENRYELGDRYPFRQVAILCLSYVVTFGAELAVVSLLPRFFSDTWGLGAAAAGGAASVFAALNLFARPGGGLFSDRLGSRRTALRIILVGCAVGFAIMSRIDGSWPVGLAIAAMCVCSLFVQSGSGAVCAIVPLVKRRVGGQIAGIVGAYGNVGAVAFLSVALFVPISVLFIVIGVVAVCTFVATMWLPEPAGEVAYEPLIATASPGIGS